MTTTTTNDHDRRERAKRLNLYGLLAQWDDLGGYDWVPVLLAAEEAERQRRSLERRLKKAHIGRFKPMADFDWSWPNQIDRPGLEDLFTFRFVEEASNVVVLGPNGVGKTMIVKNLAHQAVLRGHTVHCTTASAMLNDLAAQDGATTFRRRLRRYTTPRLLVIDEVGYLSYDNRYADLLFEVVTQRYTERPLVISTNRPFSEWNEVFPNASCVVALVDRLIHKSEILSIEAQSYRLKEARERAALEAAKRGNKPARPRARATATPGET